MEYRFSQGVPLTEEDALAQAAEMGFHSMAFEVIVDEDEPLHWHEFNSVTWVIEGTGAFRDGDGKVTTVSPGCRVDAPAGFLHSNLAGPPVRVVLATDLPGEQWTSPIDKDPADLRAV
jgi:mannose-6-phosphate isomerase-like protein (cupin superfamily)